MTIYALRYIKHPYERRPTLVELTPAQVTALGQDHELHEDQLIYDRVHFTVAHEWVLAGGHHETYLWVDDGRIKRSQP